MSKVKVSNTFTSKIITFLFIVAFIIGVIYLGFYVINKDKNNNIFDLGPLDSDLEYTDKIINSYEDFESQLMKYGISYHVLKEDFDNNSYLLLFQDYNPCGEKKPKTIDRLSIDESIKITYKVYGQCGWCERHMVLYILKVDKVEDIKSIDFGYIYENNQLNCGVVD